MKKALCIGHATYDITVHVPEYPVENQKYYVEDVVECGGGSAANAAALLAIWGIPTYFAGIIGDDTYGHAIEKEFNQIGMNLDYFQKIKGQETGYSFILINEQNASRTLFNRSSKTLKLEPEEINIEPDLIMFDTYEQDYVKHALKTKPNAISIIDAGKYIDEIDETCRMVDYLVCSKDFTEQFTKEEVTEDNIEELFIRIEKEFNTNIVITLGESGSIYRENGEIKRLGIYKQEAKDTTGAGDIFHGAFAYCILQGYDLTKTVKIASLTSALSVTKYGGRYSIPKLEEVMELYNKDVL